MPRRLISFDGSVAFLLVVHLVIWLEDLAHDPCAVGWKSMDRERLEFWFARLLSRFDRRS